MEQYLTRAVIFAALAFLVSIVRYALYLTSLFQRKTRPHMFSWINWGLLLAIGAYAQFKLGGGLSAFMIAFVAMACLTIAFLSVFYGERNITRSDWFAFLSALALIPVWLSMNDPVLTLSLIIVIDSLSFYPTLRKTYIDPSSEPPGSYFWSGARYFFILLTVPEFILLNVFYPVFLMVTEWGFMLFIIFRRRLVMRCID